MDYVTCEYVIVLRLAFHLARLSQKMEQKRARISSPARYLWSGAAPSRCLIYIFRCQLNSVLGHAWQDILYCLDGLVNHS